MVAGSHTQRGATASSADHPAVLSGRARDDSGSMASSALPVQVTSLSNVASLGGGDLHVFAVKYNGTLWAWGYNGYGQFGDGTNSNSSLPIHVNTIAPGNGSHA